MAREKLPDVSFHCYDLLKENLILNKDLIKSDISICCEVLEHVNDSAAFLKNVSEMTREGGYVIITVPAGKRCTYDYHIGHLRHFTAQSLTDCISPFFRDIKVEGMGFPFFNVYRLLRALRGESLVKDARQQGEGMPSLLLNTVSAFLRFTIEHSSFTNSRFGMNLIATARK